ncbi:hypothetical protein HDU83_004126 [Entophlyctis luteolus]|nr:hypothetical protein HDU83_004126 [Entophlyctis luteolus]
MKRRAGSHTSAETAVAEGIVRDPLRCLPMRIPSHVSSACASDEMAEDDEGLELASDDDEDDFDENDDNTAVTGRNISAVTTSEMPATAFSPSELKSRISYLSESVADLLAIPASDAALLLRNFSWNVDTVVERFCEDSTAVLVDCGITNEGCATSTQSCVYYARFRNHAESAKLDRNLSESIETKMEELQQNSEMSWIQVQFMKNAKMVLFDSRHTLKWTYCFAFYLSKGSNATLLFEENQQDLEIAVEQLSGMLESDFIVDNIPELKQKILDKTAYVAHRRDVLLECAMLDVEQKKLVWETNLV